MGCGILPGNTWVTIPAASASTSNAIQREGDREIYIMSIIIYDDGPK